MKTGRGKDGFSLKVRGGINEINKAGCLCLSSALSHRHQCGAKCVSNCKRDQQKNLENHSSFLSIFFSPSGCSVAECRPHRRHWNYDHMIILPKAHHVYMFICTTTIEILKQASSAQYLSLF